MKSLFVVLPVSVAVAGLVVKLTTETINMPVDASTLLAAVAACTMLLFGRSLLSLAGIAGLIFLANANLAGYSSIQVSHDTLLAVALTIMVLPLGLRIAGVESELTSA
jgi:hypothetical protein